MKRCARLRVLCALALSLAWGSAAATEPALLRLSGAGIAALEVDATLLDSLPRRQIEALDHGHPAQFEGVWMRDLLQRAGMPLGKVLRGEKMALALRVIARDGYVAVFALAELDPGFRERPILLADRRDGKPLGADEGPLRLVVADEARGARWVRQLEHIELIDMRP